MSKIWGIPSPFKSGARKLFLGRLRNVTANLTAYIFGTKQGIDNRLNALTDKWGLLHRRDM